MTIEHTCTAYLKSQARLCGKPVVEGKTKCRGHGALSTGPKTDDGKQRAAQAHWVHGCETRRTIKKLTHTVWAYKRSDVIDRLELLGSSRAVIQRVYDSL